MTSPRRGALGTALAAGAVLLLAFCVTALLARGPRARTVAWRLDPEVMAEDRAVARRLVAAAPPGHGRGPDVVLVVLDTVRKDRLEIHGRRGAAMPRLAGWAARARIWDRATAEAPWTLPSHASLFTGLPSARHGAEGRPLDGLLPPGASRRERYRLLRTAGLERPLSDEAVTVAERLSAAGYRTLGVAGNRAYLQSWWGLSQGFGAWICDDLPPSSDGLPYVRGDRVASAALAAVDAATGGAPPGARPPLFLFVNFIDAHVPYVAREGFTRRPWRLTGRWRDRESRDRLVEGVLTRAHPLPRAAREGWLEAYDAELRFLDAQLAALLEGLEARGIGDEAWIGVVSDHGEYFGEHDLVEHSKDVYREAVDVPVLVRAPGVTSGRDPTPVQLADVGRWIVAAAGAEPLPAPSDPGGLAVSELYGSRARDLAHPAYGARFDRVRRAFRAGDRVVLLGSDGSFEAYDLAEDPAQARDRAAEPWAAALRVEAEAWVARNAPTAERPRATPPPEAARRALEALGYVEP